MLALRLPADVESRLEELAKRTGRTKSYYAREAIIEHLADLEELYLAEAELEAIRKGARTYPLQRRGAASCVSGVVRDPEGAIEELASRPPSARRILKFLRERIAVEGDPRRIGKRLRSPRLGEFWRCGAGDWRIICRIPDEIVLVLVLKVGHRRTEYRTR